MRGDPLVNNTEDMVMANETQAKKIRYLEIEKQKSQQYIKDLQETIYLCKQSMSSLASQQANQAIQFLNKQNNSLMKKLKQYHQSIMNLEAEILIQQQLRVQEKKFYNQRLQQFENTMSELRKSLQDKEDSFTPIVDRLKKYQDLNEAIIKDKLYQYKHELQVNNTEEILRTISEQRDQYRKLYQETKPQIQKLSILKTCLSSKSSYEALKTAYLQYEKFSDKNEQKQQQIDKIMHFQEKTKNTTCSSTGTPNKELIKLLKKQKISNEILQSALNEAVQKNEELLFQNNELIEANILNEQINEKLKAKLFVLERYLSRYELAFKWKSSWKMSKCDLDRPNYSFLDQFTAKGNEEILHLDALKQDMNQVAEYLYINIPKQKLVKSLSEPRIGINIDEDEMQIEQI